MAEEPLDQVRLEARLRYLEIHLGMVEVQLARVAARLQHLLDAMAKVAEL